MLTENEKLFLVEMVKEKLKDFQKDKESIIDQVPFKFFKSELDFEGFLKDLLEKLKKNV